MDETVKEIDNYLRRLFPICRSLTGQGNRETLKILQEIVPIEIKEYPSGSSVYDWVIPDEWVIREAWIKDLNGNKLVDFYSNNLHVVNYSQPVNCTSRDLKRGTPLSWTDIIFQKKSI